MAVYKEWTKFCEKMHLTSIPCKTPDDVIKEGYIGDFFALKHDVECKVRKAYKLCQIEHQAGLRGVYYVQHYLLGNKKNLSLLKKMKDMGATISYHHDVMDSNGGNILEAIRDFRSKIDDFEQNGFSTVTVCQHGNPVLERVGYTSNRDFLRNEKVKEEFSGVYDIMVNFKEKIGNYVYISDSGGKWSIVTDPENNDREKSKDIPLAGIDEVLSVVEKERRVIISVHPHRWHKNKLTSFIFSTRFKLVRGFARMLIKIPFMKKFMSKHFELAKRL